MAKAGTRITPDELDFEAVYGIEAPDPSDLWFDPGSDVGSADVCAAEGREAASLDADLRRLLDDLSRAQEMHVVALTEAAQLIGRLDARLAYAPRGETQTLRWRRRLAAIDLEALAWLIEPSIRREQIVLHTRFAKGGAKTEDLARAFETLRWAHGRLLGRGALPETPEDYLRFLGWSGKSGTPLGDDDGTFLREMEERLWKSFIIRPELLEQLDAFQRATKDLPPLVAACGVLVAWRALGFDDVSVAPTAYVLASRTAGRGCNGGLLSVPLLGPTRVDGFGSASPTRCLGPFLEAAQNALYRALREIDRLQVWEEVALARLRKGRGGATGRLIALLAEEPLVSTDMAVRAIAATPQGVLHAMRRLEEDGLVREVTGYKRFRFWTAVDGGR